MFLAIGFASGVLLFQQLAELPSVVWLGLSLPLFVVYRFIPFYFRNIFFAVTLGFFWTHAYSLWYQPAYSLDDLLSEPVWLGGIIADIPVNSDKGFNKRSRFVFEAHKQGEILLKNKVLINLDWYKNQEQLKFGQYWRFKVKLKLIHGYHNLGSSDYEGNYYRKGIVYKGYIKEAVRVAYNDVFSFNTLRNDLILKLDGYFKSTDAKAIYRALLVGDRSLLSQQHWQVFADTGVAHLMAISGLHIGLVSGFVYGAFYFIWCRIAYLCRRWPARVAAIYPAIIAAALYAALAGFAISTQRALIMLLIVSISVVMRKRLAVSQVLSVTMISVLLWDPWSINSAGFWFSFAAVALILYFVQDRVAITKSMKVFNVIKLQLILSFFLLPLLWFFGFKGSLISPVVNLLAIPWFGFLAVPLVLLTAMSSYLFPGITGNLSLVAEFIINWGMAALYWVHSWAPSMPIFPAPDFFVLMLSIVGIGLFFLSKVLVLRILALIFLLPLFYPYQKNPVMEGDFELTLLDVGQGLSAFIRTSSHALLFDTGPRYPSGFNTGNVVILPYFKKLRINKIDMLMVSHLDSDHSGGVDALLKNITVEQLVVGETGRWKKPQILCEEGMSWVWDGINFKILAPEKDHSWSGNNASCVLRVSNKNGSVLLTGDMEKLSELQLLKNDRQAIKSDIIIAGHHGSNSSSTVNFVKATEAKYVLFANGFANRWGFPRKKVVHRWLKIGAIPKETAQSGAIRFYISAEKAEIKPEEYARISKRYWNRIHDVKYH